jgi:hypothetical protein
MVYFIVNNDALLHPSLAAGVHFGIRCGMWRIGPKGLLAWRL